MKISESELFFDSISEAGPAPTGVPIDGAIAIAFFLLAGFWSLVTPLHGAPDELNHFFLLEYLYAFGSLPRPQIDPVQPYIGILTGAKFDNTMVWYQGLPFAHVLGGLAFAKLFSPAFPDDGYLAARLFNWMLGGVFIFALLRTLRWSGAKDIIAILIGVSVAAIPQVTFIFSYFNHDAFGLAAVALALYAFIRTVRVPAYKRNAIYFGICCGLILLSKPYHWPALVFFGLMLLLVRSTKPSFPFGAIVLRASLAAMLAAAPMLAWTYFEYGDVTGREMWRYFLTVYPDTRSATRGLCYVFCSPGFIHWSELGNWLWSTFTSFFGRLGWLNLALPTAIYVLWFGPLALLFETCSMIFVGRRLNVIRSPQSAAAIFDAAFVALTSLMLLGTLVMSLLISQFAAPQAQGRYLFVVIPFAAYCIALFAKDAEANERPAAKSKT